MATFNKITIVGYLGRDPEIKYTPAGDAVCTFSVATTEKKGGQGGGGQDITTWFRITTWRRQAEVANQYLSKGKQVYIEGRLRTNEFTDRDGNKRTSLEVTATDLQFLGGGNSESDAPPKAKGASVGSSSDPQAPTRKHNPPLVSLEDAGVDDSDVPF